MQQKNQSEAMTLRDLFASCALGYVSKQGIDAASDEEKKRIAQHCYELADAMLEERKKGK